MDNGNTSSLVIDTDLKWYVLHTRSRQEKALASDLEAMGVSFYLPLVRRARYYGRRKVYLDTPLFPSYLFLRGTLDEAYSADRTKRVAQIIRVVDQEQIEWELENIRRALSHRAPLEPYPYLKEGTRVEVSAGPFRGLQGLVDRRKKKDLLILQVEAFGRGASLEIEASLLEPID